MGKNKDKPRQPGFPTKQMFVGAWWSQGEPGGARGSQGERAEERGVVT